MTSTPLMILLALVGCSCSSPAHEPPKADKVLIIIDTLRADAMHYAGNPLPTTPNIDALAAESAWFSRAYSASTWTLPGTASIYTGELPSTHRAVRDVADRDNFGQLSDEFPTIATALKQQGYRTAAFVNNTFMAPTFGLNQGFDTYNYQGAGLIDHRTAQETVDEALAWLASGDEPAFLVVHIMEPHADYQLVAPFAGRFSAELPHTMTLPLGPFVVKDLIEQVLVPEPEDQAYLHAVYLEEVAAADAAVGALLDALRKRAGWDASTVVLTSDHGEEFWEYGTYEHGHRCNSVVTQVPLVVKSPEVKVHRNDSVVSLIELHPLMTKGTGDLHRLASSGVTEAGRLAVSEDTNYGNAQASIITDDLRLTNDLETNRFWFHTVAGGVESTETSKDIEIVPRAKALRKILCTLRGDLSPTPSLTHVAIADAEDYELLKNLGYVEVDTPSTADPKQTPDAPATGGDPCDAY